MKMIKPFCVKISKFSIDDIISLHELIVERGITVNFIPKKKQLSELTGEFYFGVSNLYFTRISQTPIGFDNTVLNNWDEIYQHLGINKKETSNMKPAKNSQINYGKKGRKILPRTSSLLKLIYDKSEYVVRGVTDYNIQLENGKLYLKYSYYRKHQTGETHGTEKVHILNDLKKVISLVPNPNHPNNYIQKVVLNLVPNITNIK